MPKLKSERGSILECFPIKFAFENVTKIRGGKLNNMMMYDDVQIPKWQHNVFAKTEPKTKTRT